MKHFNKKIKITLVLLIICLFSFVLLSKTGILFSTNDRDVIMVSTTKKSFNPSYALSATVAKANEEKTTTTSKAVTTTTTTATTTTTSALKSNWSGSVLSKNKGVVFGPSGKETYYNLDMTGIVNSMRHAGYSEQEYPYWIREDGVKMLGQYVMVAANYEIRPKGSIIESSLGYAIVCDTGGFAKRNPTQIDVAVNWR